MCDVSAAGYSSVIRVNGPTQMGQLEELNSQLLSIYT
jgi:hypothetical protein